MTDAPETVDLDCIGLLCPLPVLKSRRALRGMAAGARLSVRSTDPMAVIDIPHMCATDGHTLIEQRRDGEMTVFLIERGADRPA
jgi:tRNA 2-thiouridine synthesizing protein A